MHKILISAIFLAFLSSANAELYEVTENNWERLLSNDEWMVEFYAPWCPACNRFESVWKEFSEKSNELRIKVGAADVNANPVLSGLFSVTSLPTVYHIKEGQYRVFNGNRDIQSLTEFIAEKKWKDIEPSSSWLTPNSFLIKMLSLLFKATLHFKDLYTHLNESYGLPTWAVLGLFVLITIFLGLILGVALIVCIDFIFPPKKIAPEELLAHANEDDTEEESEDNEKKSIDRKKDVSGKDSGSVTKRKARAKKDE